MIFIFQSNPLSSNTLTTALDSEILDLVINSLPLTPLSKTEFHSKLFNPSSAPHQPTSLIISSAECFPASANRLSCEVKGNDRHGVTKAVNNTECHVILMACSSKKLILSSLSIAFLSPFSSSSSSLSSSSRRSILTFSSYHLELRN